MFEFQTKISNFYETLNSNNTLYALKGFNYWLDKLDSKRFFLGKSPLEDNIDNKVMRELNDSDSPKLILYENLINLSVNNLIGGISAFTDYKIVIVENDFFDGYYPDFQINTQKKAELFESVEDNVIHYYYGDIKSTKSITFINYNQILDIEFEVIKLTEKIDEFNLNLEKSVTLYNDINAISFQQLIFDIINDNAGKVKVGNDNRLNIKIELLKQKFKKTKLDFEYSFEDNILPVNRDDYNDYLEILKRKNKEYDFMDIEFYKDPYESTELVKINQSVIIDRLIKNSIASQKQGEKYRDIFVTAPTGAGKSILFQIPAIYLAEKFQLVTIVISPLIGLMNDQVNNIKKITKLAATINSDYTPSEKESVLEEIKNGSKSILYLSPETLLSNTDITNLIGDRKIGLLVIDEAHIVSTWGKSFRPDYWYLGDFISRLRKFEKTGQNFPLATFTATSTFGGEDNMYIDIVESLKMTPERFLGKIKRNDIKFNIRHKTKKIDYQGEKIATAVNEINKLQKNNEKTLVYVPYTRHIDEIYQRLDRKDLASKYYGKMVAGAKNETLEKIVTGEKNLVIATKAFGMGIDIDDITNVYHFAPTGNIPDYVQEIGRAARKKNMQGIASTDFYKEDFRYINQLFGMSSIKDWQVVAVLGKILDLYRKHKKRNFLVSPMEFSYIFANESDSTLIDSQLKTCLLIIKKDFEIMSSSNYIPLIFKPRSMFTNGYFMIEDDFVNELKNNNVLQFFEKIDGVNKVQEQYEKGSLIKTTQIGELYKLNFKELWEQNYKEESFANFKRLFFNNELSKFNFKVGEKLFSKTIVEIKSEKKYFSEILIDLENVLNAVKNIFDDIKQSAKHFTVKQLASELKEYVSFKNSYTADLLAQSIIYILNNIEITNFDQRKFATYNSQTDKWNIQNSTYETRIKRIISQAKRTLVSSQKETVKYINSKNSNKNIIVLLAQVLEILELAEVNLITGDNPEFFIRVNSPQVIDDIVTNKFYKSKTIELVNKKHVDSTKIMEHFFTILETDEERWDFIEKYFLGQLDNSLLGSKMDIINNEISDDSEVTDEIEIINKQPFPYVNWIDAQVIHPIEFYHTNSIPVPDYATGEIEVKGKVISFIYLWEDLKVIVFDKETIDTLPSISSEWKLLYEDELIPENFIKGEL